MSISPYLVVDPSYGYIIPSADPNVNSKGWITVNGSTINLIERRTITNSNDPGKAGEVCFDTNYIYFCVTTNTWKRILMSSW